MNKLLDTILDEQRFPYEGMTKEERNYYLNIIRNCKDIVDSEYKIDGIGNCEILQIHFKKRNNKININGSLVLGTQIKENRTIDGYIFVENNRVIVDMHIIRLSKDGAFMEYTVLDEFKIINDKLIRDSFYNHNMNTTQTEINDEIMKGKLKWKSKILKQEKY